VQFLRTTSGYSKWMPAVVGFVKSCKWTQLSLLFTRGVTFQSTVAELSHELLLSKVSLIASMSFEETVDDRSLSSQLRAIQDLRSSQVVVVMALESMYWKIALAAQARGMLSGWAWLGLDCVPLAPRYAPLEELASVNLAFDGWIFFQPHFLAGRDFFDRVRNATRFDFPTLFDEDVFPSPYAAAMYNAIILIATVANRRTWLPEQGGRAFVNQSIGNMSFEGPTDSFELDANGDVVLSYEAVNLLLKKGTLQQIVIGVFGAGTYLGTGMPIIWPGGLLALPADAVIPVQEFSALWMLVGGSATALVVLTGFVVLVLRRRAHLQAILVMLLTEVGQLVLSACMSIANLVTDGIVFDHLLRGDLEVSSTIYTVVYATILCFGVFATVLSQGYRIRNARLMQADLQQLSVSTRAQNTATPQARSAGGTPERGTSRVRVPASIEVRHQVQQHEWELAQTHRTKVTLSLSLLSLAAQGP
jgi:hypothetical protein